jgi:hypothetical protein
MPPTPLTPKREPQSISVLLPGVLSRDQEAIRLLWHRFAARLIGLAQARLGRHPDQLVDGADVANDAYARFVELMGRPDAKTRFNRLENREQIWRVLARITVWEALDWVPTHPPVHEAVGAEVLEQVAGTEPEPDFGIRICEEVEHLIGTLHGRNSGQTERLRRLARLKMNGRTNHEAARELNCCVAQVELLLRHIRETWKDHDPRPRSARPHES